MPLVLLGLFGVIQGGIHLAGLAAVQQAAMAGAERGSFMGADHAGIDASARVLAAQRGIRAITVDIVDSHEGVGVTVTGRVPTVLPGDWSQVSATSYRVKEG